MVQLPDEIYLYILQCLPDLTGFTHKKEFEDYRQTSILLATICRTSRFLRTFAEPLLYRAYIEDEEDCNRRRSGEADECTRLQLFLRTLIRRPDLAVKVEYLKLADCLDHPDAKWYCPFGELFVKASEKLLSIYASLPLDKAHWRRTCVWQDDWKRRLRRIGTYQGAEVVLLLTLLPNLGSLDMYASERNTGLFVQMLCHDVVEAYSWKEDTQVENGERITVFKVLQSPSSSKLPFFSRLRTLTLAVGEGTPSMDMNFLKNIACIPSLESLCIEGDVTPFAFATPFRLPLQHIRNLTLKECTISDIYLRSIVESCGSLRSLRIKLPSYMKQSDTYCNLQALLKSLTPSFQTLEELQIYLSRGSSEHNNITPAECFDLRSFTKLRALEINMEFLFASASDPEPSFTALLPTSIDDIYLRMADKRFAKHLQVLAEEYKSFPNLKTLDIGIDDMPSIHAMDQAEMGWKMALNYCARELRNGGIECNVPVEGTHFNLSCGND
ncbi:unnamed protein product [Aureobasidium vineae]|uniref:F-box domain-containing protein n=1 Tax=Aureobasidium vineae TaxID=2773715 RepID=A0A9N8PIA1_9PEZI|nr:unnamed protein product [Aureobasidium vineae]